MAFRIAEFRGKAFKRRLNNKLLDKKIKVYQENIKKNLIRTYDL